jgi:hypothetical protein
MHDTDYDDDAGYDEEEPVKEGRRGTFRAGSNAYFKAGQQASKNIAKAAAEKKKAEADKKATEPKQQELKFDESKTAIKETAIMNPGEINPPSGEKIELTPDSLITLLKLAGINAPAAPAAPAVLAPMPSATPCGASMPDEIPMEEEQPEYSNSPDEEYSEIDELLSMGTDLHKPKGTYNKVAGGDNPMQPVAEDLGASLWKQYQALKKTVTK